MNTPLSREEYLKNRVNDQIDWYSRKSGILKRRYRWMKILTISFGVLIPVVLGMTELLGDWVKYVAAGLGAGISALEGISSMLKDKDNHLAYRLTSELLKREAFRFQTESGQYADDSAAYGLFVENCERIMSAENAGWRELFEREDKPKK